MEHRPLGRTGVPVSKLCLGAMMFGAWGNADHDDSIRIIHARARRRDQLHRHRRRLLGRRVGGDRRQGAHGPARRRRARHQGLRADGRGPEPRAGSRGAGSSHAVEDSLRRLGTDYIDLYQIHRPDPDTDLDETLGALTDLVHQGKVRYIGSSTAPGRPDRRGPVDGARPRPRAVPHRAAALLHPHPRHRARRPADRAPSRHGHPHLQPARRRLALRALTADSRPTSAGAPAARGPLRHVAAGEPAQARSGRAARRGSLDDAGLSLIELAIAFVVNHPAVTSAIIGPRTMEHLDSQLPSAAVELDAAVLDRIDEIVRPGVNLNPADTSYGEQVLDPALRRRIS